MEIHESALSPFLFGLSTASSHLNRQIRCYHFKAGIHENAASFKQILETIRGLTHDREEKVDILDSWDEFK